MVIEWVSFTNPFLLIWCFLTQVAEWWMPANLRAFFLWWRVSLTSEGYLKTRLSASIRDILPIVFFCLIPHYQSTPLITHLYGALPLASHISTWVSISPGPPICSIDYIALILAATASAFKGSVTGCDCWHGCIVTSHLDHLGLLYTATSRHGHTHTTRVGWLL